MIKDKVNYVIKKYGTRDPFRIAKEKGILIMYEDLGSIQGYYTMRFRTKQIHINRNIPYHLQKFTAAHELGHAILHPNESTPFLKNCTLQVVDKLEIEANKFAVELLIPDSDIAEYSDSSFTIEQIARIYGYTVELLKLKENLHNGF